MLQLLSAIWYKELDSVCQHDASLKASLLCRNRKREQNSDYFHISTISSASNFALPIRGTISQTQQQSIERARSESIIDEGGPTADPRANFGTRSNFLGPH